jgi:hypothetical protein
LHDREYVIEVANKPADYRVFFPRAVFLGRGRERGGIILNGVMEITFVNDCIKRRDRFFLERMDFFFM